MFKKITNFIKYSNVFTVVFIIAFVAIASAVASNDNIKKNVIGEEIVEKSGIDNSVLLAEDLDNFDLEMKIVDVTKDPELSSESDLQEDPESLEDSKSKESVDLGNYYVDYQYKTLGIQDDIWQEIFYQKQLVISKEELQGEDLGLYVSEELGEIIDYEIAFLKEVQENEKEKGQTFVQETTKYTGLIGLVLDTRTKELPGYEPVVKPAVIEVNNTLQDSSTQSMEPTGNNENFDDYVGDSEAGNYPSDSFYYQWLIENCLSSNGYWYNDTCNAEAEVAEDIVIADSEPSEDLESEDVDTPICDSDNIDLCDTQELCEGVNLYWYNEICNISQDGSTQSMEPTDIPAFTCDTDHTILCDAQEICEDMNLYWYNEECNIKAENSNDDTSDSEPLSQGSGDDLVDTLVCDVDNLSLCNTHELCEGASLYWYNEQCNIEAETVEDVVTEDSESETSESSSDEN